MGDCDSGFFAHDPLEEASRSSCVLAGDLAGHVNLLQQRGGAAATKSSDSPGRQPCLFLIGCGVGLLG